MFCIALDKAMLQPVSRRRSYAAASIVHRRFTVTNTRAGSIHPLPEKTLLLMLVLALPGCVEFDHDGLGPPDSQTSSQSDSWDMTGDPSNTDPSEEGESGLPETENTSEGVLPSTGQEGSSTGSEDETGSSQESDTGTGTGTGPGTDSESDSTTESESTTSDDSSDEMGESSSSEDETTSNSEDDPCWALEIVDDRPLSCSVRDMPEAGLTIRNDCLDTAIEVFWVDHDCQERSYGLLAPGASMRRNSFISHPWHLRAVEDQRLLTRIPALQTSDLVFTIP